VCLGAGVLVSLGDALLRSPELHLTLPVGDIREDLGWSMSGVDFSLALMMSI